MGLDLSSTQFAKWSQALMNALVNLHGMNAEAVLDSNLPRIVVFGDQSAGKSSLVEGVTGIRVPRDSGTCTRCPMELSMFSTGDIWSCDISLHFRYGDDGRPVKLADVRRVPFGETLQDKAEVELALRRAQAAILHPSRPIKDFLSMSEDELRSLRRVDASKGGALKFSKNTIGVTIHDSTGANLSFLDLPGLITNETRETIDLVQELAVSEIKKENSLILVTVPMTGDMELQTAVRLAREVDPEGLRTIGALTKPDAVPKGASNARRTWMDVLSGREQVLRHGYYCVRLPDDDERMQNLTREGNYEVARKFFEQESPWKTLTDKRRLGIPGLVEDLSRHLTVLIDKALPKLRLEVQRNLEKCQTELNTLPPAPKLDPSSEILKMINDFSQELNAIVFGSNDEKSLVQENRICYDQFKSAIRATAPNFVPSESQIHGVPPEDEFEECEAQERNDSYSEEELSAPLYLRDINRIIKGSITWELPHDIPFDAKKILIRSFTDLWTTPAKICYEDVAKRLEARMQSRINKHFEYFPQLRLHITTLIEERLFQTKDSAMCALEGALRLERELYFTQNQHYFNAKRDTWLSHFKEQRRIMTKPQTKKIKQNFPNPQLNHYTEAGPTAMERALSALTELGYEGLTSDDLGRLVKPDPFEEELNVMADVKAYFHVAYKRIIDQIPLTIEIYLNRAVCGDLQNWLAQKLEIGGHDAPERLAAMISQDPKITSTRARLEAEISKLKDVQKELRGLSILNDSVHDSATNRTRKLTHTDLSRKSRGKEAPMPLVHASVQEGSATRVLTSTSAPPVPDPAPPIPVSLHHLRLVSRTARGRLVTK